MINFMYGMKKGDGAPWVSLFGMCFSGALTGGAWKIINRLAKIKFPTSPFWYDNPKGTLSYLAARSRWADWWLRIIMRTMFDAVAKPITSGIDICRTSAPTALPIDYATEADDERQSSYRFSRQNPATLK